MENNADKQVVFIEELFNASPQRVFSAWTDPEKLLQWYAPEGCAITFKKIDVRPGGIFHSCISNPKYGDCWCIGEYKEIVPYGRIVFTMINADESGRPVDPASIGMDPAWPGETLVTLTFSEQLGKTKLQLRQTVSQTLAQKTGAYSGWLQMLNNLQRMLNPLKTTT